MTTKEKTITLLYHILSKSHTKLSIFLLYLWFFFGSFLELAYRGGVGKLLK